MRSNTQRMKDELANSEAILLCAQQCGVIGDATKLRICYLLRHYPELNVTTIAELVGTSISNVSHSLSKLRAAKLVKCRKDAQTVFYSIDGDAFKTVLNVIGG